VLDSLSRPQILYRPYLNDAFAVDVKDTTAPYGAAALLEIFYIGMLYPAGPTRLLETAIQRSVESLEVLVLRPDTSSPTLDLDRMNNLPLSLTHLSRLPFMKLTHLKPFLDMTPASLDLMVLVLSSLYLVHLGVSGNTGRLLYEIIVGCLQSLQARGVSNSVLEPFYEKMLSMSARCQIVSIRFISVSMSQKQVDVLKLLPLRWLCLYGPQAYSVNDVLQ
jgi:hypothetical protein